MEGLGSLQSAVAPSEAELLWIDHTAAGLILAMVVATPFAIGSVPLPAARVMEAALFLVAALLMLKWALYIARRSNAPIVPNRQSVALLVVPLAFLALACLQVVGLPAAILKGVSHATYQLNVVSLRGWPGKVVYTALFGAAETSPPAYGHWRPLSLAPAVSEQAILKAAAFYTLFITVLLFPFTTKKAGSGFSKYGRLFVVTVIVTGAAVALLGLLQMASWNGRVMWFYTPVDWRGPRLDMAQRAVGPFVNPDHFADYLLMSFAPAMAAALRPMLLGEGGERWRPLYGLAALVIAVAILLSGSRAAWVCWGIEVAVLAVLLGSNPRAGIARRLLLLLSAVGLAAIITVAAFEMAASPAREAFDSRLNGLMQDGPGLAGRWMAWRATLAMIRDFPIFGVGLGCWSEVFARYQKPPWLPVIFLQAHNDYLELLASAGLVGFAILGFWCWEIGRALRRNLSMMRRAERALPAALMVALGAVLLHECVEFSLQIPANALLFTLLLAVMLRIAAVGRRRPISPARRIKSMALAPAAGAVAMVILALAAMHQRPLSPRWAEPSTVADAIGTIFAYPAREQPHVVIARKASLEPAQQIDELETALWLNPNDPYARDLYAQALARHGAERQALAQMTRSVFVAPSVQEHFYLQAGEIGRMSPPEREAVLDGLTRAVAAGFPNAGDTLVDFYTALGDFGGIGQVYLRAAEAAPDGPSKAAQLAKAAYAYAKAGELERAYSLFDQAIRLSPEDATLYEGLISCVYAAQRNWVAAQDTVALGIKAGADPVRLYSGLSQAAAGAGDRDVQLQTLERWVNYSPASFEANTAAGEGFLEAGKFDRAAFYYRRASELQPDSARTFFNLGLADEQAYNYAAASRDYAKALALAPNDSAYRTHVEEFQRKVADNPEHRS